MAQIKINSQKVIDACDKQIEYLLKKGLSALSEKVQILESIQELAEYSIENPETEPINTNYVSVKQAMIWLDHNDFQLLRKYL